MYFDVNVNQTLNSVVTVWTYQYITGGPRIRDRMGKLFVARLQIYEFIVLSQILELVLLSDDNFLYFKVIK
jgi:hypothetical protein